MSLSRSYKVSVNTRLKVQEVFQHYGKSQQILADELKCSRQIVSKFLNGKAVDKEYFQKICDALGLNWQEVVYQSSERDLDNQSILTKNTSQEPSNTLNYNKVVNLSSLEISHEGKNYLQGVWIPNSRCREVLGREDFIEKALDHLTNPQESYILSVSGGAGYGKTEAASEIAKEALRRHLFTDVLWVTARQTELVDGQISQQNHSDALNWNQFINQIAHQLTCPIEHVQQRLREERFLVVLDNAETSQVEDILGNLIKILNPSRALLTSRFQSKSQFVGFIQVQGLQPEWSYKLLANEAKYKNIPAILNATKSQFERIHKLSDGAPLALHFIVGRVADDETLEPVLLALEEASGDVEVFYRFSLETAWQRINATAKSILRYMGHCDAGVTWEELSGAWGVTESEWNKARRELKRWYLIEDIQQDIKENQRYDLHPWVRRSLRGGLVDNWQASLQDLEKILKWKFDIDI
jgi:transcriptional regulator with XRE-family HTH domain